MRLIDAVEAEQRIVALWRKEPGWQSDIANTMVDAAQSIILDLYDNSAVNLIMCANCKWMQCNMRQDGSIPHGVPEYECRHWCGEVSPEDFCSYGEKDEAQG